MRKLVVAAGLVLVQTLWSWGLQEATKPSPSPSSSSAQALPPDLYLGGPFPAVTPSQARRIVSAWWPLHESALAGNDIALTDALEGGAAGTYDDAVSRDNMVRGGNLRVVRQHADLQVLVPWTPQLPASFLAEVNTTVYGTTSDYPPGTPYTEILVFSRQNDKSPWTVLLRTGHTNPNFDDITAFPQGDEVFDSAPPIPGWISPKDLPGRLAAYWSYCYQYGPPSKPPFVQGYWTTQRCPTLQSNRLTALSEGIKTSGNYYADLSRDGFWEFNVYGGWDLACFTVRLDQHLTPISGLLFQEDSRNNYGGWLAPGRYSEITSSSLHQSCALIPPTSAGTPLFPGIGIVGGEGGIVAVTGTPGRAAPVVSWSSLRLAAIIAMSVYVVAVIIALAAIALILRRRNLARLGSTRQPS